MKVRKIENLLWAGLSDECPNFATNDHRKARGAVKKGHSYEKKFGQVLEKGLKGTGDYNLLLGQWIRFEDSNGLGWAQPDVMVVRQDKVTIFECKLTESNTAWAQLLGLYTPLLENVFPDKELVRVQVCRNLKKGYQMPGVSIVTKPKNIVDLSIWNWRI